MTDDLLTILVKVVMTFIQKLFITPLFDFLDAALFGATDTLS